MGTLRFANSAGAGDAIITTNASGRTLFTDTSSDGTAQLVTNAGGTVDISGLTSSGLSVGSIAGAGNYVLGAKNLTGEAPDTARRHAGYVQQVLETTMAADASGAGQAPGAQERASLLADIGQPKNSRRFPRCSHVGE
ncbi:hypothetical protein HU230_0008325 [Bradyrhizobium quebecense]|uniref:Uncharacterized protein n=1 Tax=Bradyrhizobium quebecense TaxID=2748629 RepID=A0A973WP89_9BRAD|nr:hypothetical protein [Bradyrhizobium quebecense]UGA46027.1 hypothetical protein HU230_0008325 [Bradyrhizobium quebecense]